ncbi:NAD dependent epimerase/dehydratase [Xylaria arbuscula]|uniref:NAD(P)-binding domain-containing protein n=1 Tax=Xylaria arbuscula TaxID=114810 RepID=A0A9W8N6X0_9PEZI|nr:NAD dependent epimerase/dehydratase [Xylaria arbuscula]KAJ3560379.1 hypothetical protein NPX13_g9321 [Xylaria arbuscula]
MAAPHVLLIGGNGKIARLLTPMLLKRSWTVTSMIRNADQVPEVQKLGENQSGRLNVLVKSLEDVATDEVAKERIDAVKPDYVVWSAGAGGKGPPERTWAVDRDAACRFIRASVALPYVKKFVMISFITSRLEKAPWWPDDIWEEEKNTRLKKLERYYQAKVAADQVLYEESKKRADFAAICMRPALLTEEPVGKVALGRTPLTNGTSSRASVAYLTALLLENPDVKTTWLDMLDGDEDPEAAVKRCVDQGVSCLEGEPYYP